MLSNYKNTKAKIVLIDDDVDFLCSFKIVLDEYRIDLYQNVKQAINNLEKYDNPFILKNNYLIQENNNFKKARNIQCNKCISVIIADYAMPYMNGVELFETLVHHPAKKILLSGVADCDLAIDALNRNIIDTYLKKGDMNLCDKIKNILNRLILEYDNEFSMNSLQRRISNATSSQIFSNGRFSTSDRVLITACNYFFIHGFNNVRMDDIADQAHVSKSNAYKLFGTKEKLLFAALKFIENYIFEKLHEVINDKNWSWKHRFESVNFTIKKLLNATNCRYFVPIVLKEFNGKNKELNKFAEKHIERWQELLRNVCVNAKGFSEGEKAFQQLWYQICNLVFSNEK